ncbi:MAG: cytochrome P450 [Novosphingobium sp.]
MDVAIEIPDLPIDTPEFSANPDPFHIAALRDHPWLGRFAQGYAVYGYQAHEELMADDENLVPGLGPIVDFYGMRGTMWGRFMEEMLLTATGDFHTRLRASVQHAFTPRRANEVRPLMQQTITALLDEWAPKGAFDFAEFASYFPISVMFGLLGVPTEPIHRIRSAIEQHVATLSIDPATKPGMLEGWEVLWNFADGLVKEREAAGALDEEHLLDAMIAAKNRGQLSEDDLRFMLLTTIIAGYDTSKNQLGWTMKLIVERPEIYKRCAEDKDFCGKVVTESLRYAGIASPYREVAQDFTYRGVQFRKGEIVIFATSMAGRDPTVFDDPLTFDPMRENAGRHVSFGRGTHICIGQYIAKNQLQEGIHLIAQRLKNPRIVGEVEWRPFIGAWGPKTLPIAFDAA